MENTIYRLHFFIIIIFISSCSSKKVIEKSVVSTPDTLHLNEFYFTNPKITNLVIGAKKEFKKEFKKDPKTIRIELFTNENKVQFDIICLMDMHIGKGDKEFYNEQFIGGTLVKGTLVLLKSEGSFDLFKDNISIKKNKKSFVFSYGGNMISCVKRFELRGKEILLIKNECPFEIFTD
jgi:hypothetical protein